MTLILKGFSVFLILSWPFVAVISVMALGGPGATNDKEGIRDIILVLYYPVFITSVYWITGSSLFGISGRTLVLISVIIITLGLHTSGYFKLASNAYRGINNEGYSVLNDKVYYDAQPIPIADADTFRPAEESDHPFRQSAYYIDKYRVYYAGEAVPGIDPNSFRRLTGEAPYGGHYDYWGDNTTVVYNERILTDSAPHNLEILGESYAKSNGNIYHYGRKVEQADADSFTVLNDFVAKDNKHIYYSVTPILPEADPDTFQFAAPAISHSIAVDKNNAYLIYTDSGSKVLADVDITSLQVLENGNYIKDTNAVYRIDGSEVIRVSDANPSTFRTTRYTDETPYHATDDVHYWINGELIK